MLLELFLMQVKLATLHNGRDRSKIAVHLATALENEALQVLADQSLSELQDMEQLVKALQWRFPESNGQR